MRFIASTLAITASCLTDTASAWYGAGHLLVSRVAYEILQKQSPQTITQVESILSVLKTEDPDWTKLEGKHPMVECVTFADDIKFKGGSYQSGWHFIDTPFLDQGGDISDYNFTLEVHNITEALSGLKSWFNKEDGYKNTEAYTQIMTHGLKGHSEA
jgi:hypothetical protein